MQNKPSPITRPVKAQPDIREKYLIQTYVRCQSMHMLGGIYPLNEILIPPGVIPPPLQISPDMNLVPSSIVHIELPYTPDWPEFLAEYSVKSIPVSELLKGGKNIAIVGRPGTGKTTALASLASFLAIKHPSMISLGDPLPIMLHARELIEYEHYEDVFAKIVAILSAHHPDLPSNKLGTLFQEAFLNKNVVLLIDGLDELPRTFIHECNDQISQLFSTYPGNRLVVTGPIDFLDGFFDLDIAPVAISLWTRQDVTTFIKQFLTSYFSRFEADLTNEEREAKLYAITSWVVPQKPILTPFEYTLQVVSALTGNDSGKTSFDILNSYINQMVPSNTTRASLEVLAYQTLISQNPIINKYEIDHYVPELVQLDKDDTVIPIEQVKPNKALSLVTKKIILQQTNKGNVIFTHPIFLGFLASNSLIRNGQCQSILEQPDWSAKDIALTYLAHIIDISQYIDLKDIDNDAPMYKKLFTIARWIRECKQGSIFRPQILRRLAQMLNSENQPVAIRTKAVSALLSANEKNITGLFKQYIGSTSPIVRKLCALAMGCLYDPALLRELGDLLADTDQQVRIAASMAIAIQDDAAAEELSARILLQADEHMRRAVAEIYTHNPVLGKQTIVEGATHKDILVRRACVYALGLSNETWAKDLLKKLQNEDGQWVIKNTAAQALENIFGLDAQVPRKLIEPYLAPWIVAFAARQSEGVSPTVSPIPLLLKVLTNGTEDEKIAAIEYLSASTEEGIISRFYDLIYSPQPLVREYAFYALWKLSLSGVQFPATQKFGFA